MHCTHMLHDSIDGAARALAGVSKLAETVAHTAAGNKEGSFRDAVAQNTAQLRKRDKMLSELHMLRSQTEDVRSEMAEAQLQADCLFQEISAATRFCTQDEAENAVVAINMQV
eukprot:jgi/Ulvmu1/4804/UM020_0089.1